MDCEFLAVGPKGTYSPHCIQYDTERPELEMAALGHDDILGSLLIITLLLRSGDVRAGFAPVEGKGTSKSRSREEQGCVCGTRARRLVTKGGDASYGVASRQDGAEGKDIGLGDCLSFFRVWYPLLS